MPKVAAVLRKEGYEVFDDWFAAGPIADDSWQAYEQNRGHGYQEALRGYAARNVFAFDKHHIDRSSIGVLCLPAGKSGHLELGYMLGRGKRGYILLDGEPDRYDVMYQFANGVFTNVDQLVEELKNGGYPQP